MPADKSKDIVKIVERAFGGILILFFLYGATVMPHLTRKREISSYKGWIVAHGQTCIDNARPILGGFMFALCPYKGDLISSGLATDGNSANFLVYDTSDQIALLPEQRSEAWVYSVLKVEYGMIGMQPNWIKVQDHFYAGGWVQSKSSDESFAVFAKKYECKQHAVEKNTFTVSCEKYKK